jgi:nitrate/TMAO reductase-like tetraheme cytochrome c subunit
VKLLKRLVFKLYVLFLMAFAVWYGYFMYPLIFGFEGKEEAAASLRELGQAGTEEEQMFVRLIEEQARVSKTNLGFRVIEQPYIEGRFHHIGFSIQKDQASLCVRCHGNVPHDESRELRSFLNMHAFYLACETCHVPAIKSKGAWQFRWYDKDNGRIVPNPRALHDIEDSFRTAEHTHIYPTYGNYGAKIAPGEDRDGNYRFLFGEKEIAFAERFINEQDRLGPEQKSQMKQVIHRRVGKEPMECKSCHNEIEQYLPLAELGYPPRRVAELTASSVVGMIQKYKEFYIPNFLTPGRSSD